MKYPQRIGFGKCKKCGRRHSTAPFACLENPKERAMRLDINSSGIPVGENKPTYAQLESEITRLRKAIEEHKAMTEVLCVREDFDNELYKVLEKT